MAGGTRVQAFAGNHASDVYFAAQRKFAKARQRTLEAFANGQGADAVAEHAIAGGLGFHHDVVDAGFRRGLREAYREAAGHGINSIALAIGPDALSKARRRRPPNIGGASESERESKPLPAAEAAAVAPTAPSIGRPTGGVGLPAGVPWRDLRSTDAPTDAASMTLRAHTKAVDYAADRAAQSIKGVDDTTRDKLQGIVRDAVALHWDQTKLEEKIQDAGVFSDERAEMIARTEVSHAQNQGLLEAGRQARDVGRHITKIWVTDGDPCPICLEAEAEGELDLDDEFDVGETPPAHPNCMCEIQLIESEEDEESE